MNGIAPGVWQLSGFPPHAFNVYLVEDVLIDAGTRWAKPRIFRQLEGRALTMVALVCEGHLRKIRRAVGLS
jgi:hypothetical protein